jgi:hypothetical protein
MSLRACQADVAQQVVVEPPELPFARAGARVAACRVDQAFMDDMGETGKESGQSPVAVVGPWLNAHDLHSETS